MLNSQVPIMLVEDDQVDVINVQRAFRKNNITNPLLVANNGLDALNLLRGENGYDRVKELPKIILLDLNMPRMNGLEFLKELRSDEKLQSISVFVMTTSNDDRDRVDAYKLNVAGYIIKPVTFENFVSTISILDNYWNLCEQA